MLGGYLVLHFSATFGTIRHSGSLGSEIAWLRDISLRVALAADERCRLKVLLLDALGELRLLDVSVDAFRRILARVHLVLYFAEQQYPFERWRVCGE